MSNANNIKTGPIPYKKAKLVFTGDIFKVYQWKQRQFDGSYKTFERLSRPDSSVVIASVNGKIITTIERQPDSKSKYFSLPGGRIEENEAPLAAAKRELLEETGYSSNKWSLFNVETMSSKIKWDIYWYIAKDCKKVADPDPDPGEKIKVRLIGMDEFLEKITSKWSNTATKLTEIKYNKSKRKAFEKKVL